MTRDPKSVRSAPSGKRARVDSLPFNSEFQRKILKLCLVDDGFCTTAIRYLQPAMFESDSFQWAWREIVFERNEGRVPTMMVLRDRLRRVDRVVQPRYNALLDQLEADVIREEGYIREALAEFVRRALFVQAYQDSRHVYNLGQVDKSIDLMRTQMETIHQVTFEVQDRCWFFAEFNDRQRRREHARRNEHERTFPTGILGVDDVLGGGLSKGELGVWIADSKGGKSLFLSHLAVFTSRVLMRKVLMIVLEGTRAQVEDRLDTMMAGVFYREVKLGMISQELRERMEMEYRSLRDRLVIWMFTSRWNYNAADIRSALAELKATEGWDPDQLIVDYGDLLRSQSKAFSEEEQQRNAFSDLKTISTQGNDGYSTWTASQARRPSSGGVKKKGDDGVVRVFGKPVLAARNIADSYNKIRRSDFIGSINQDRGERDEGIARLYCELYRDNRADRLVRIKQHLDRMVFADLLDESNRPDMPAKIKERMTKRQQAIEEARGLKKEDKQQQIGGT